MKKYLYYLILSLLAIIPNVTAADSGFIEGIEDVPLMSGLKQLNSETITFGNEESRFVEVLLVSPKFGFKKIEKFYKESLPQLGWNYQGIDDESMIFYRDSESLTIGKETSKPLKIRITIKNRI